MKHPLQPMRSVLASGVLVLLPSVGGLTRLSVSSSSASASWLPAPVAGECLLKCELCPATGHSADTGKGDAGEPHAGCWAGNTCEAHVCNPEDEVLGNGAKVDLSVVWKEVVSANPDEIIALAERLPNVLTYNHSRRAIQLLACEHQVWAHVPVSEAVASVLEGSF